MDEQFHTKEVYFNEWCDKCQYGKIPEDKIKETDPCWNCLTQGWNYDSHKPIAFKEKEK